MQILQVEAVQTSHFVCNHKRSEGIFLMSNSFVQFDYQFGDEMR